MDKHNWLQFTNFTKDIRWLQSMPLWATCGVLTDPETQDEYFEYERHKRHPLLNRARTGHNASRAHLYNVHIEEENTCRHCEKHPETLEHQILQCDKLQQALTKQREEYHALDATSFNDALWKHPIQLTRILKKAKTKGTSDKPQQHKATIPPPSAPKGDRPNQTNKPCSTIFSGAKGLSHGRGS